MMMIMIMIMICMIKEDDELASSIYFEYVQINLHYINDEDAIKNNTVDYYQRGMVLDQLKFASK